MIHLIDRKRKQRSILSNIGKKRMNLVKLLSDMIPAESKKELVAGITAWLNSYSEMQQTVQDIKAMQWDTVRLLQEIQTRFDTETHYNDVDTTMVDIPEPPPAPIPEPPPAPASEPTPETETD